MWAAWSSRWDTFGKHELSGLAEQRIAPTERYVGGLEQQVGTDAV